MNYLSSKTLEAFFNLRQAYSKKRETRVTSQFTEGSNDTPAPSSNK